MSERIMTFLPECPHCGQANMTFYVFGATSFLYDGGYGTMSSWQCSNCGGGVCGESMEGLPPQGSFDFSRFSVVYPEPEKSAAPEHTPDDVARDYLEAVSSLKNKNIKSACIMARSAIETAAVQFGAQKGGIKDKIKYLADKNIITQSLADWANEIKDIGNDATHAAERHATPTLQDAEDAVNFAEMLLTYLFTLPGMIEERKRGTS